VTQPTSPAPPDRAAGGDAAAHHELPPAGTAIDNFADLPEEQRDPHWYKRAVFYEVLVRSFMDSNGDGSGDLPGLVDKLDYLSWLGVDCIWLPPFFRSPLRDGGYDVSDYTDVLPDFGTLGDFVQFVDAAHERGIRVIIDFVMNHTSDQHAWFQSSRTDPDGPYGDFYVWADDDEQYADARIIFVDTEVSNWTYDPVRKQYFWHRFFSHQPDLNFENPRVQEAVIEALKFWLDLGIDGFRLDAVPYLFEQEGTNCENLPATHEFLRHLRKEVDAQYPDRVLLCEANQWPADVVEYFGDGDECHMAFHFPVMPRLFMGVRRESRYPISEIMAQTPEIPNDCQWGIFLRNHDELTLEMVTDEERDYMWGEYAKDPRMKANIGIRRRLAPLLDNDRNQLELFTALLLSLPGSPVLYYGDEIGMGDNIWLGDRDGVRTPMQWTPDRNAGFSTCNPGQLFLPVIMDPIYGHTVTNVEQGLSNSTSLLHWTRRMIEVRKQNPAFGLGTWDDLGGSNPSVLSFVRVFGDDIVLCVNNLSRFPQPVELDLRRWEGYHPVELLGTVEFPEIGELPYLLTLAGHGFYWFRLTPPERIV
jgi:maltose alpha-D-glucosyltransferase/alpha-amylase